MSRLKGTILIFCLLLCVYDLSAQGLQGRVNQIQGATSSKSSNQPRSISEIRKNRVKIPRDWKPSMLKINYDMVPAFSSVFGAERTGQAFQASIDFDQFFFTAEYGQESTRRGETFDYQSDGTYFSFGPEVNFLRLNTEGHGIIFGLRYGHAEFSDQLSFTRDSTYFGGPDPQLITNGNPNLKANWMEMTLGLSAKVWKNLYMGYTVRYKVLRQVKGIGEMAPYDVTGFGLYEDNTGVRFNYYIGWAIQFREKYEELLPEAK